jgi:hypothetical protein
MTGKTNKESTVQISTSNLPQLDWGALAGHPSPDAATSGSFGMPPTSAPADLLSGSYPSESYSFSKAESTGAERLGKVLRRGSV